ncbi:MAG TPA: SpoIIE family protein phosphatase, partial [Bacteroidota bacterium]|nr:SpoIIE family protein phosphatase [Bacteroidota bacterium]
ALVPYQEGNVVLSVGDVLVLFTDGVSESMNIAGEEWGEQKLEEVLLSQNGKTAETILSSVVDAVKEYSHDTAQYDDITLVVLRVID